MYLDQREFDGDIHYAIVAEGDEDLASLCLGVVSDRESWFDNPVYLCPDSGLGCFGWMLENNVMYCLNINGSDNYDEVVSGAKELFPQITIHDWLLPSVLIKEL